MIFSPFENKMNYVCTEKPYRTILVHTLNQIRVICILNDRPINTINVRQNYNWNFFFLITFIQLEYKVMKTIQRR